MQLIEEYLVIFKRKIIPLCLIIFSVAAYILIMTLCFPNCPTCMIKAITGIPCPTCGITRAYLAFFHLDFKGAFYYHPLFFVLPFIIWMILFKERPFWNRLLHSKLFWFCFTIIYLGTYIIRFILIYPNAPMDITKGIFSNFF